MVSNIFVPISIRTSIIERTPTRNSDRRLICVLISWIMCDLRVIYLYVSHT